MSDKNPIASGDVKQQVVGKLFQEMDETVITWKIPNFTEKMSDPPCTHYDSTTFAFSDTCWYLVINPNGDIREETKGYVGIYLMMTSKHSCEFSYTMSMKDSKGVAEFTFFDSGTFDDLKEGIGNVKFCEKSTLMNRKSELLPNDTLTVVCRLKRGKSVLIGVSRTERLLNLQKDLKKILTEKDSCDLALKLQDQEIKAHKVILENRCKVFKCMLSHDMIERKTGEITIDDIEPDVFREVLAYVYCCEVENLSTDNMCELYVAADKYQLDDLKKLCAVFIAQNLSVDMFFKVLEIPETCTGTEMRQHLQEFFSQNFESIVVTEKWKNLERENKDFAYELVFSTMMAK